jgi:hypothetical protein
MIAGAIIEDPITPAIDNPVNIISKRRTGIPIMKQMTAITVPISSSVSLKKILLYN